MDGIQLVSRAADLAARRHVGDRRKGRAQEPYINHLAEVAALLADHGADADLVAAGWLHDTIEDTETTRDELEKEFGANVASLVAEATDDKSLLKAEQRQKQIENAPHKSAAGKALKIADKISNVRSLMASPPDNWERDRLLDYVSFAEKVVAGCRDGSTSLADLFDRTAEEARSLI
ncbi:HD domain-containing protein [Terrihabitans sp. B22-R8]|uniref:HD domain-containing protein n=1 Tax=Terrihabitans sp. B22-R8 TaxID=3425128 RepID=UPI00403C9B89